MNGKECADGFGVLTEMCSRFVDFPSVHDHYKMKSGNQNGVIYTEVVVIGNGPSGIALSYMLSGHVPYLISDDHPDEMLAARLRPLVGECLLGQDLGQLSDGLEGRTTNQMSLLLDALLHPCADVGLELEPLVEFRRTGIKFDHIVLGKGPPGGSWHHMDPQILTLSLGSWMSLPGLPLITRDSREKRAYASNVAKYYVQYTEQMDLAKHFRNNVSVHLVERLDDSSSQFRNDRCERSILKRNNWVKKVNKEMREDEEAGIESEMDKTRNRKDKTCFISNAINCLMLKHRKKSRCKRPRDSSPKRQLVTVDPQLPSDKKRSISLCCDSRNVCDKYNDTVNIYSLRNSCSLDFNPVPSAYNLECDPEANWLVTAVDTQTGEKIDYSCKYLVLATGGNDLPNRLEVSKEKGDPNWLVYDLRSLEEKVDAHVECHHSDEIDPVLVVGAGLSAADAIIATRGRNIPVIHVFRNKSPELNKLLPENLYPEYHKVHQMMTDGGSTYPLYTAYPEYNLTDLDEDSHTVILTSKEGVAIKFNISYAVVLIGSRPDLSFLSDGAQIGVRKDLPVDCKTNTVDIDRLTYGVNGYGNLFVLGPLAGDNFVRFLPGGALAVIEELYKRNSYS
ncbi:unnamed protein product [Phaedon cochleariae]|uniref:Oxidative stress-induced growth inhibitor 2 n=1 Tax=Phaedon cochleariae TaxID=80249 RepID=A0A9N9X160_PHACE|nr:unnamed protein product [Phaedon cochleariae]